jgi:hypothetical protein
MIDLALGPVRTECVIWPFQRDQSGYAKSERRGQARNVCRELCRLRHGSPPWPHYEAAHTCGNGHLGCVNPDHLKWKTPRDNAADKVAHGTRGKTHVTAEIVLEIRRLAPSMTYRDLADQFGLSGTSISRIVRRAAWKHI